MSDVPDVSDMQLAPRIHVGGVEISTASPPRSLVTHADLGIVAVTCVDGQVVHRTAAPSIPLYETRATVTPGGDYLLMFPEGGHYGSKRNKVNDLLAYRSHDRGTTWVGPTVAFDIDYNQHGFIPLIPRGTSRLYAFGTQPMWDRFNGIENAAIGFRYSDDDGHTWSDATLIEPVNDPGFMGMSVMRMCETDAGAWLLGSHTGSEWFTLADGTRTTRTRQYILRSRDQGRTWTLLPGPRPAGWYVEEFDRMDGLRPISLGKSRVYALARTCEGHLWETRSDDDGRTWSNPRPTVLVHPDAPPMLFHLAHRSTLLAFHHNRHTGHHFNHRDRSEIWISISTDGGYTWSEPRFVFANALDDTLESVFRNHQCSYMDMFADGDDIHLFVPHRWRQVLHLRFKESDLQSLPTRQALTGQ